MVEEGGRATDEAGTVAGGRQHRSESHRGGVHDSQGELKEFESPIFKDILITVSASHGHGSHGPHRQRPTAGGKPVTLIGHRYEVKSTIFRVKTF